jgi:Zn-dependent peptidase ImmA (M78 family)/transcriptional regulator with XRE-family HTH domain
MEAVGMTEEFTAQPGMLVLARESRGWTQADLAEKLSQADSSTRITQGYVSRAESGRLQVRGERVQLFAEALGYTAAMLCGTTDIHGVGVGLIHHRKRASLGAPSLRRIHATLTLTRLQIDALEEAVDDDRHHQFRHVVVDDFDTPDDAADTVRDEWNVTAGPVPDLVSLLEQAGARVVVRDLETGQLDAVSQWGHNRRPLFLVNTAAPADRFRFSLAHELGHIVMHHEPGDSRTQEEEADRFAAEFLMPYNVITAELKRGIDLASLRNLKSRWGVSMAALIRRAQSLGAITEWQYRNLMVEMSALGYRTDEPIDLPRETPHRIAELVVRFEQEHGLDWTRAADLAGLNHEEFHQVYLCAAPSFRDPTAPARL